MSNKLTLIFSLLVVFSACKKEDQPDGVQQFVGIYDSTKSSQSYDDPLAVSIDVIVELDSTDSSLITINGMKVPVSLEGTYGPEVYEGNHISLEIIGDALQLLTYPANVPGIVLPCYIKGTKR